MYVLRNSKRTPAQYAAIVSDAARKVTVRGKCAIVFHKFDDEGRPVKQPLHYTRCTLDDLEFIDVWRSHGWDAQAAGRELGLGDAEIKWKTKKLAFIEQEDKIIKAKTKMLSPEYVISKDLDNLEKVNRLEDTDHKSLDRLAKVQGMFKSSDVTITQNVFNLPKLSEEAMVKLKEIADREADVIDTTAAA